MAVHNTIPIGATGKPVGDVGRTDGTTNIPPCTPEPRATFWSFLQVINRRFLDLSRHDGVIWGGDSDDPGHCLGCGGWRSFIAGSFGTTAAIEELLVGYRQHADDVLGFKDRDVVGKIGGQDGRGAVARAAGHVARRHRPAPADCAPSACRDDPSFSAPVTHWRRMYRHCLACRDLNTESSPLSWIEQLAADIARGTDRHPRHGGLDFDRLLEDATLGMLGRPA